MRYKWGTDIQGKEGGRQKYNGDGYTGGTDTGGRRTWWDVNIGWDGHIRKKECITL